MCLLQIYPDYKPYAVAEPNHGPSMLGATDTTNYSTDHSKFSFFLWKGGGAKSAFVTLLLVVDGRQRLHWLRWQVAHRRCHLPCPDQVRPVAHARLFRPLLLQRRSQYVPRSVHRIVGALLRWNYPVEVYHFLWIIWSMLSAISRAGACRRRLHRQQLRRRIEPYGSGDDLPGLQVRRVGRCV